MNLLGYKEPNLVHLARCKVIGSMIFLCSMEFFSLLWRIFLSSAMNNLVSSTIEIFLSAMDKLSISSRLIIWNLDPRANVVQQEAQYRALRRPWKTLSLIWGWVLMIAMVMMMVLARVALKALPLRHCTGLGIQFCRWLFKVKSYLTGKEPRERLRELVLEEHVECGCQCDPQV